MGVVVGNAYELFQRRRSRAICWPTNSASEIRRTAVGCAFIDSASSHPWQPVFFSFSSWQKDAAMPKKQPTEVHDQAVGMTLDRSKGYLSMRAAYRDLSPKLNIGAETVCEWVTQAQADTGERWAPTSDEYEESNRLRRENPDLRETNDLAGPNHGAERFLLSVGRVC